MDLLIVENGDGGDLVLRGNDLVMVKGIENVPYLASFGGDADWWANDYLDPTRPELKWLSETESILRTTPLNSNGRQKIEQAVLNDLAQLKKQTNSNITVQAIIANVDRLEILINIDNLAVQYIWNPDSGFLTYKI